MFYKKLIFSILLFAPCSMNAMSNQTPSNNEDKRFFLMRWYKAYEHYVLQKGLAVSLPTLWLSAAGITSGMFAFLWKLIMISKEKNVGKDPVKLAALYKESRYISLKDDYRLCGRITLGCLIIIVAILAPFIIKDIKLGKFKDIKLWKTRKDSMILKAIRNGAVGAFAAVTAIAAIGYIMYKLDKEKDKNDDIVSYSHKKHLLEEKKNLC